MSDLQNNGTNEEIELKMALGEGAAETLSHSPLLASATLKRMTLGNRYFDTSAADLRRHKLALRIRKGEHDSFTQTLKSAGKSEGGLSQRGEWQWACSDDALNLQVLKQLAATDGDKQPALQVLSDEALLAKLKPVFITDFTRLAYTFEWKGTTVELAIDQGVISVGHEHRTINEVELEVKQGKADALWSLANEIAATVAVRPANASKASRAAALITQPLLPDATPDSPADLFAAAITGLDTAQDAYIPEPGITFAEEALQRLSAYPEYSEAQALAQALKTPDWELTQPFGQAMMQLAQKLSTTTK